MSLGLEKASTGIYSLLLYIGELFYFKGPDETYPIISYLERKRV